MKNKRKLNKIAKRLAKTILMQVETPIMLDGTKLTEDEVDYVGDCMIRIAERITQERQESDVNKLVNEEIA